MSEGLKLFVRTVMVIAVALIIGVIGGLVGGA